MKFHDFRLGDFHSLFHGHVSERMHDRRDVDSRRALDGAGVATHTDPHGGAFQRLLPQSQLHQTEHGVGMIVHGLDIGTSPSTRSAVPAQSDVLSASLIHLIAKGAVAGFQINQCRREHILIHGKSHSLGILLRVIDLSQGKAWILGLRATRYPLVGRD